MTPAQRDERSGLSRRTLISAAAGGAGLIMLGGLVHPAAALAAVGGTIVSYDDNAADPTNWRAARYHDHAGYPAWSGKYDAQGNKIGTERDCTNYVAWRLMFNGMTEAQVPRLGGAGQWAGTARAKGITVDKTPAIGAVAQWSVNDYHVAWVEQIYGDGTLLISESDWPGASHWLDYRRLSISQVENFIHIRDGATTAPAPIPKEEEHMVIYPPFNANSSDGVIPAGIAFIQDGSWGGALRPMTAGEYSLYTSTKSQIPYRECTWDVDTVRQLTKSVGIVGFTINGGMYKPTGKIIYDSAATADYPAVHVAS